MEKPIYPAKAEAGTPSMATPAASISECPICHAEVPAEAAECPRCGETFGPLGEAAGTTESTSSEARVPGFREKFLYYAGIALILLGGPGIALGSWLHDILRISYLNYNSFDVFGPVNRLVLAIGLIVMIVGVVFLILSLRLTRPAETDVPP